MTPIEAVKVLREALQAVEEVANESEGIAGWHRSDAIAGWSELLPEVFQALAATENIEQDEPAPQPANADALDAFNRYIESVGGQYTNTSFQMFSAGYTTCLLSTQPAPQPANTGDDWDDNKPTMSQFANKKDYLEAVKDWSLPQPAKPQLSDEAAPPIGYTDEWIKEQYKRTLILVCASSEEVGEVPFTEAEIMKSLRVFGNRVLMEFGSSEGMHRAFSEAYERDKDAERYRWLRNTDNDIALVIDKVTGFMPPDENYPGIGGYPIIEYRADDELDSAIDAAIAQNKGQS